MVKVVCISACQVDRKILYKQGSEYEVEKEFLDRNPEYFKKISNKKAE